MLFLYSMSRRIVASVLAVILAGVAWIVAFVVGWLPCCVPPSAQPVHALLLDLSTSASVAQQERNAAAVINRVAGEQGRLLVTGFDSQPLTHDRVDADISFSTAAAHGNKLLERKMTERARADARDVAGRLLTGPRRPGPTDVFAAVAAAERRLSAFGEAPRRLSVLSDMVNTAGACNLTAEGWSPAAIDDCLTRLDAQGLLPELKGVDVVVGGAGLATGPDLSTAQVMAIEDVWRGYFARTGATLLIWQTVLLEDL